MKIQRTARAFAAALILAGPATAGTAATSRTWAAETQSAAIPAENVVAIDNFTFGPRVLTVKAGTTVTWQNRDDIPHTIVDKNRKAFRSKVLDTDDTFSFTFTQPGTYDYFCGLHPHMTGQVIVTP